MPDADRPASEEVAPLDCQSCGACCVEAGAVILDAEDDIPVPLVQYVANLRCMVTEGTSFRCAALLGTVGRSVGCGIYGRRPTVCRSFDAGSDECLSARDAMERKRAEPGPVPPGYDARPMPPAPMPPARMSTARMPPARMSTGAEATSASVRPPRSPDDPPSPADRSRDR